MKTKSPSNVVRLYDAGQSTACIKVVRIEDAQHTTVLGVLSFDRVFGDLEVKWTVDGRALPLAEKVSHIVHFVRFIASL